MSQPTSPMKLHGYWRSSSSYRVRIALGLKSVAWEHVGVHLLEGQQAAPEHVARNPMGQVPLLECEEDGTTFLLTQSVAILEYLEERFPAPPLLPAPGAPGGHAMRAEVRRAVEICNAGIQPLQNLSVLRFIKKLGGDEQAFGREANQRGLGALEHVASRVGGAFLVGGAPSLADVCLVPQLFSARRFGVDVSAFPRLLSVEERCAAIDAFAAAHPDRQPDATP